MEKQKSVFGVLSSVDISKKIETKGNVKYLSWSYAWEILKENYPTAKRNVYENSGTGLNYFTDGNTAYVKVGVEVDGIENIDYLPIMDFRNQSIRLDKLTSMDVNKAIQRSTAKAIAMHGLGLQLWTGEDMPEMTTAKPSTAKKRVNSEKKEGEGEEAQLPILKPNTPEFTKIEEYINANKALGEDKIVKQIGRKYLLSALSRKMIQNMFK
jgi:hypothetical protein